MEFDGDADYVYLNLGGSLSGSAFTTPSPAVFSLAPQQGIVSQQAARYFAVSRVTVVGARTLPAFCAPIDVLRTDSINNTTLALRIRYQDWTGSTANATGYYDATVTWIPQNNSATLASNVRPQDNVQGFDVSSNYYFAQDVQWVVDLVNNTVATAWAGLVHANKPAVSATAPKLIDPGFIPVLTYDGTTNLFSWNVPSVFTSSGNVVWSWDCDGKVVPTTQTNAVGLSLYLNDALATLLANFPYARNPAERNFPWSGGFAITPAFAQPDLRLRFYQAAFAPTGLSTGLPAPRAFALGTIGTGSVDLNSYWVLTQTSISADTWSPVAALVLEAAGLNAVREIAIPPGVAGVDSSTNVTTFTESTGVADIVVDSERPADVQGLVIFSPPFHRWVSLEGGSLPGLKIFLKWRSVFDGILRPVYFVPGSSASMKLCLRARALGAGN